MVVFMVQEPLVTKTDQICMSIKWFLVFVSSLSVRYQSHNSRSIVHNFTTQSSFSDLFLDPMLLKMDDSQYKSDESFDSYRDRY